MMPELRTLTEWSNVSASSSFGIGMADDKTTAVPVAKVGQYVVKFDSEAEATSALGLLRPLEETGRTHSVSYHHPQQLDRPPSNTLFIQNLPQSTRYSNLVSLFSTYPGYRKVVLGMASLSFRIRKNNSLSFVRSKSSGLQTTSSTRRMGFYRIRHYSRRKSSSHRDEWQEMEWNDPRSLIQGCYTRRTTHPYVERAVLRRYLRSNSRGIHSCV